MRVKLVIPAMDHADLSAKIKAADMLGLEYEASKMWLQGVLGGSHRYELTIFVEGEPVDEKEATSTDNP